MTQLTAEAIDAIAASVARGCSLRRAAHHNHFTDDQVDEWLRVARGEQAQRNGRRYSEAYIASVTVLTERCTRAIGARYSVLTDSLYLNATTPDKYGRYDTQAADKLLSKAPETREEWHEHRDSRQVIEVNHSLLEQHRLAAAMSDAELLALANGE